MLVSTSPLPLNSPTIDHTPAFLETSSHTTTRPLHLRSRIVFRRTNHIKRSSKNKARQSPKQFWDLPPELRLQIYSHLVLTEHVLVHRPLKQKMLPQQKAKYMDLRFMRTSRRMYEEAKGLLYKKNYFHVIEPTRRKRIVVPTFRPVKYLKQAKRFECNLALVVNDEHRDCWQPTMRNAFRFLVKHSSIFSLHLRIDLSLSPFHTGAQVGAYAFVLEDIKSSLLMLEDVRVEDYVKIEFQNYGESIVVQGEQVLDHEPKFYEKLQALAERLESAIRGERGPFMETEKKSVAARLRGQGKRGEGLDLWLHLDKGKTRQ